MSKKILVVDDQAEFTALFKEYLQDYGYEVDTATIAKEALEKVRKNDFDLVVTDMVMPGMSGLELGSRIKNKDREMPLILVSAFINETNRDEIRQSGVDLILEKPLRLNTLRSNIDQILAQRNPLVQIHPEKQWKNAIADLEKAEEQLESLRESIGDNLFSSSQLEYLYKLCSEIIRLKKVNENWCDAILSYIIHDNEIHLRLSRIPKGQSADEPPLKYLHYISSLFMSAVSYDSASQTLLMSRSL